jgi:hypothetical protein
MDEMVWKPNPDETRYSAIRVLRDGDEFSFGVVRKIA